VERALAERAIGYTVDVEEWFVVKGKLETKTVRKHYPPDVTAGIFWTKNRMSDRWRDLQRHEVTDTRLKSADELRQLLAAEFQDLIDQGLLQLPAPRKMERDQTQEVRHRLAVRIKSSGCGNLTGTLGKCVLRADRVPRSRKFLL
jgi:hypothetical protein